MSFEEMRRAGFAHGFREPEDAPAADPKKCRWCQERDGIMSERGYCSDYCEREAQHLSEPGSLFDDPHDFTVEEEEDE